MKIATILTVKIAGYLDIEQVDTDKSWVLGAIGPIDSATLEEGFPSCNCEGPEAEYDVD